MAARRFEAWTSLVLLLLVVALALLAQTFTSAPNQLAKSVASTDDDGRRALLLVLQELGLHPAGWVRAPGSLPRGEHLVWLPQAPTPWHAHDEEAGTSASKDKPAAPRGTTLASHGLGHYRRFVEEGGTIVCALDAELRTFLETELGLEGLSDVALLPRGDDAPVRVRLGSGEELELELASDQAFRPLGADSPGRELWVARCGPDNAPRELPLAIALPLGAGRVVVLADDSFVRNDALQKRQNALAAVRLCEELGREGEVLFDEYALGVWEPESALGLSFSPRIALFSLHALALLALFVWSRAVSRAFPRDPLPLDAVSPLERARAQARLWRAAGRSSAPLAARARGASAPRRAVRG